MRFYPKYIDVDSCIITMRNCSVFQLCPRKPPGWSSDSETFDKTTGVMEMCVSVSQSDIRALKIYTAEKKMFSINSSHHVVLIMVCNLLDKSRCENPDLEDQFWHPNWYVGILGLPESCLTCELAQNFHPSYHHTLDIACWKNSIG